GPRARAPCTPGRCSRLLSSSSRTLSLRAAGGNAPQRPQAARPFEPRSARTACANRGPERRMSGELELFAEPLDHVARALELLAERLLLARQALDLALGLEEDLRLLALEALDAGGEVSVAAHD